MSTEPSQKRPSPFPLPLVVGLAVGGLLLICCGVGGVVAVVVYARLSSEDDREMIARVQVEQLTSAVQTYKLNNSAYPVTLAFLAQPQPNGGPPLVQVDALFDPWGQGYNYNPAGPNNGGLKPDIWCQRRDKVIGNWPVRK